MGDTGEPRLEDEVESLINTLDKLYKEKPAGFFAYIATCSSAMKIADLNPQAVADLATKSKKP